MIWHATFFAIDVGCVAALVLLLRGGPDWMQCSAICWLLVGFVVLALGRAAALSGDEYAAELLIAFGRTVCHLGVIVYVLRLFVTEQARRCLPKSLKPSRN